MQVNDSEFVNNTAGVDGGGVFLQLNSIGDENCISDLPNAKLLQQKFAQDNDKFESVFNNGDRGSSNRRQYYRDFFNALHNFANYDISDAGSTQLMYNNTFKNNSAAHIGGAIHIHYINSQPRLIPLFAIRKQVFTRNKAFSGGAISIDKL